MRKEWSSALKALFAAGVMSLGGCGAARNPELLEMARQPLDVQPWSFAEHRGEMIHTEHYQIYTTIDDNLYKHLLARLLEATHDRMMEVIPEYRQTKPLDCYVFDSRGQWESYTRARAGSNAPIYLQISSGGYCQEGVFAGYDIGRDQTLSVVAHEAWHQYSWFAFKDRLPSWLEEGMATQNEAIDWQGADPVFKPETNWRRNAGLRQAIRNNSMWSLTDLVATHAGLVIKESQGKIDAYYAELWSLVLFLQQSPVYAPRLKSLLADASAGKLNQLLAGSGVTQREIQGFTEHWNAVAGPLYLRLYINPDLAALEREYLEWAKRR